MSPPFGFKRHHAKDSTKTTTSPTRPTFADRPCPLRTTFIITIDRARAPQVRPASPYHYFGVLYFFQYLSHLSLPPSGHSLSRVISRLEWIETVVQSVGWIVELPFDDPRLPACVDVDREVSRIDTTRHTPGVPETTYGKVFACWYQ